MLPQRALHQPAARARPNHPHRLLAASDAHCTSVHGYAARRERGRSAVCRAEVVSGEAYEDIIDALARRALALASSPPASPSPSPSPSASPSSAPPLPRTRRRLVVGVAGAPGSGKSTLAAAVAARANALAPPGSAQPAAVVLPMDGFHLYRRQLDAMPDPKEAHARRGAPWTFDAAKFVGAVRRVREAGAGAAAAATAAPSAPAAAGAGAVAGAAAAAAAAAGAGADAAAAAAAPVLVPSFDHGVGDPVEDDVAIPASAAVVLVEGNYVLLDSEPWRQLRSAGLLDEAWFVDCPLEVAMGRVFARQTAIGLDPEVSRARIASNDRPNAELVAASARFATLLVPSTVPFRGGRSQA